MAAAASSSSEITNDGPVINLLNKRLRALKKKLNRIAQMEESLAQGKTLNKEQEETFRSKSSVLVSIEELEKFKQPLTLAVTEEIQLALEKKAEKSEVIVAQETPIEEKIDGNQMDGVTVVAELLPLMYFASTFDLRTLMNAPENIMRRTHERTSCLTYDYITDEDAAGDQLHELDFDLIVMLGSLLVSRPVDTMLSHKNALQKCVEHAKLWLANSEQPIEPNSNITYAGLREKLSKIMASDYYTTPPQMKAPVEVVAATVNYSSYHQPLYGSGFPVKTVTVPVESSSAGFQQEEEKSPNSHGSEVYDTPPVEEHGQGEAEVENISEQAQSGSEVDQNMKDLESKQQQHQSRRSHYRGGRGGGRSRSYSNGRGGGRGSNRGGGYYQNGRGGQSYDQTGVYYPKNSNNYRGRGGRGGGYHAQASQAQEAS